MKRSELRRSTPLRTGSPSLRRCPVPAVSKKRARESRQRTAALKPLREAQTWCARCGQAGVGLDAHELLSRARGGSITDLDNIVLLCRPCHDDVTFRHHEIADADQWIRSAGAA